MKIDRLIGIITTLLQNERVTAPYLAEKYEVSRRTINRDIDDICKAGIPIITTQGVNGGISIANGYKIDKTLFTDEELEAIFTGLASLDSVADSQKYQKIIEKFGANKKGFYVASHIMIDLSSHYKYILAPKIADIQHSIEKGCEIEFNYYSSSGERKVVLDPYLVVFQWSSWYVFGFSHAKAEFRLYKLNRVWELQCTDKPYIVQDIPEGKLDFNSYFTKEIEAVILFDKSVEYKLVEVYGKDFYESLKDGMLRFEFPFTNKEYLLEWVLSFGDKAELLEPKELRNEMKKKLENSLKKYFNSDI